MMEIDFEEFDDLESSEVYEILYCNSCGYEEGYSISELSEYVQDFIECPCCLGVMK
jgi:hypothetical protein